ncbi:hypothetical protein [Williamsia sp. CHRR-6]|uniref:hypothetical protein n=1 Tax=Williamsia sp. CHRR-6 TaxID=2835871 RepID=UPI001BDB6462|nr:hypothetical protein [Williamsia sp. CHRR-6]MBT0566251.1 hypothetical protein [Williamsia sp. CHRR-6]
MWETLTPTRRAQIAALTALSGACAVAFVVAPGLLAGSRPHSSAALTGATGDAIAGYVAGGRSTLSADLSDLVDYWQRYHLIKAGCAGLALIAAAGIVVMLWRARRAGDATRTSGAGLIAAAVFAAVATVLLMANVQGALAPLASLLSMLPMSDPTVTGTVVRLRAELTGATPSAPLSVLIDDFARYHLVLAIAAAVVALALGVIALRVWRHARLLAVVPSLLGASTVVLVIANVGTAAHPAPALLGFLTGG